MTKNDFYLETYLIILEQLMPYSKNENINFGTYIHKLNCKTAIEMASEFALSSVEQVSKIWNKKYLNSENLFEENKNDI